jgi:hypothetical protein
MQFWIKIQFFVFLKLAQTCERTRNIFSSLLFRWAMYLQLHTLHFFLSFYQFYVPHRMRLKYVCTYYECTSVPRCNVMPTPSGNWWVAFFQCPQYLLYTRAYATIRALGVHTQARTELSATLARHELFCRRQNPFKNCPQVFFWCVHGYVLSD